MKSFKVTIYITDSDESEPDDIKYDIKEILDSAFDINLIEVEETENDHDNTE